MLADAHVVAVVATTNIDRARRFYGETLGLRPSGEPAPDPSVAMYEGGGGTRLLVYERATAGDSEATSVAFTVTDFSGTIDRLRVAGVKLEDYDLGDIKTTDGVMSMGGFRAAWFKDPDGNIISVTT